jgi:hypothetical protein
MAILYRLLGWRTDLTGNQDTLLFLTSLRVVNDVLVYRIENQGCGSWGIRVANALVDNPGLRSHAAERLRR